MEDLLQVRKLKENIKDLLADTSLSPGKMEEVLKLLK